VRRFERACLWVFAIGSAFTYGVLVGQMIERGSW
jgi:hypothetical protein